MVLVLSVTQALTVGGVVHAALDNLIDVSEALQ